MRVIAGRAGGVPLLVPRTDLRPTMDQVRAAIFSSLAERVPGARVLDLFAGSGALGIEALSRGAASAVFVERDRRAADCITRNLAKTKLDPPATAARVLCQEVFAFLGRSGNEEFDLVFADPPYARTPGAEDSAAQLLENDALLAGLRASNGLFVLEKAPRKPLPKPALAGRWQVLREKRYGGTEVVFLQPIL